MDNKAAFACYWYYDEDGRLSFVIGSAFFSETTTPPICEHEFYE